MLRSTGDRVVIVGGGIAGALLARTLQNHADVVLIDPKEYFEIPWANLRAKMEPAAVERTVIPHTEYLTNAKVVTASAVGVDDSVVLTSVGCTVAYDFLVVATGRMCNRPQKREERLQTFEQDKARIASAESVLVVGGGPIGVELAAEIVMGNPEKRVTIVHGGPRLLMVMGEKASAKALEWLRSKNVTVLLDQTVDVAAAGVSPDDKVFTTSAGETVAADCHFVCTGRPIASGWLRDSFLGDHVDENGRVVVDEHLRVGKLRNVFAIGDITDVPEAKQGYLAQRHAMVVSRNLKLLVKGGESREHKLHRYKASKVNITITLGRRDALSELPFMTVIGHLPGAIKPRDHFISRTRRMMGLKLSARHDQSMFRI
ncbi:ferroptosis suppressor protein 1-like [Oryza brachyantha]|uniref:ferroptosis suppressor protein 1-like n=1 Tax=Oryza brachyantha TaxID=4533 RepID=UPI001ADD1B0B|nr:ferroptosis suppressor protein 1-like [Oryza brachyantha]